MKPIILERGSYKGKDGVVRNNYHVTRYINGDEVRADIGPSDPGGYALLEVLYKGEQEVTLDIREAEMVNDGVKTKYKQYFAQAADIKTGEVLELPVKPYQKSDVAALTWIVNSLAAEEAEEEAAKKAAEEAAKKASEKK